jgi:MFS family permease
MAAGYELASVLIPPEKRGQLFSVFNATFFLSWGIAATFITGPVTDLLIHMGKSSVFSYKVSFIVAGAMILSGLLLLIPLFIHIRKSEGLQHEKRHP